MKNEKLLSKKEIMEETGLKVSFIDKAIKCYQLPYYKIGKSIKFKLSQVNLWIEQRKNVS